MGLVDELKSEKKKAQAAAGADYARLLARAGSIDRYRELLAGDDPAALGELRAAMGELGLTDADVEGDVTALADHAAAVKQMMTPEQRQQLAADIMAAKASVHAEASAAAAALFALIPVEWAADVYNRLYSGVALSFAGAGRPPGFHDLDHGVDWTARIEAAKGEQRAWIASSFEAENEVRRLVAAHPRVLGDAAAVAAGS